MTCHAAKTQLKLLLLLASEGLDLWDVEYVNGEQKRLQIFSLIEGYSP